MATSEQESRVQAVVFDLGSTLIYFDGEWPQVVIDADAALIRALKEGGLELDEILFLENFRQDLEAYYLERDTEFVEYTMLYVLRRLLDRWGYPDVPDHILHPALEAMYAVSQRYWKPEQDAILTLQELSQAGYRMGLISNAGDDADVKKLIDNAGLRDFFEVIISSAEMGIRKPNPRIFHYVLDRLGVPPEKSAMVGDMLGADILGAHNTGMYAIWINRRADNSANKSHADTIHPDAVIHTLAELPEVLQHLPSRPQAGD